MPELADTQALYGARPTLSIDGRAEAALSDALLGLLIEETTDGLYRCEATFGNWGTTGSEADFLYFDRALFDFGKALKVEAGSGDAAGALFDGVITGLEARFPQGSPPELVVLAEDRLQELRMTRRTRSFEDVTVADVVQQVASDHGLSPQVDLDGPTWPVLAQVNQSDLAFLRERVREVDGELWVEGSTLHAKARARRDGGELSLTWGRRLREMNTLADLACQRTSLIARGWDRSAKDAADHEAGEDAISPEVESGDSGPATLKAALGERVEKIVHPMPTDPGQAQAMAEARFRQLARRFVTGAGVAEGDARIRVGGRLTLAALGPLFDGAYTVTEVRHTFDAQTGFRSRFRVERPWLGRP